MIDFIVGTVVGGVVGSTFLAIANRAGSNPRAELRKKKRDCLHEWHDAGKVGYGYGNDVSLYCPLCDSSRQVSEITAKILLNEVMIRKLHDGSRKMQGAENNMKWRYEQEVELQSIYRALTSKGKINYVVHERMVALEALRETLTGVTRDRERVIQRMERDEESRKADPLQLALARNKRSQVDRCEALHRLERAVINKAWDEHMKELNRK